MQTSHSTSLLPQQARPAPLIALLALGMLLVPGGSHAAELPPDLLNRLQQEQYADRENAAADLLAWARGNPAPEAMDELYRQSRTAAEAEVRGRCQEVLRTLVDEEYQRDGVGYMGVRMNPLIEPVIVAGEAKPRFGIRLIQIEDDTPARGAGLVAGDVMLGINERMWREGESSQVATEVIKGFKPRTKVSISLFRDGKLVVVPMVLGKRPAAADMLLGFGPPPTPEMLEAIEKTARDEYFRRWLARKRALAP